MAMDKATFNLRPKDKRCRELIARLLQQRTLLTEQKGSVRKSQHAAHTILTYVASRTAPYADLIRRGIGEDLP